jgi:hypothetical protein
VQQAHPKLLLANSIEHWARNCRIVYDKFHVLQHANKAIDEVRRAEFFRKGGRMRGVVKGKRWLLLTSGMHFSNGTHFLEADLDRNRFLQ